MKKNVKKEKLIQKIDVYTCIKQMQLIKSMKKLVLMLGIAAIFTACNQEAKNEAGDAQQEAEATEGSVTYTVDASASNVEWFGEKITGWSHKGTVDVKSGEVSVENGAITSGNVVIDMNTITEIESVMEEAKQTELVGHLMHSDFFNVDSFPTAELAITSATASEITANLTIKGITKSITFPYTMDSSEGQITATAEFAINRADWDVRYASGSFFENLGDDLIKDEIKYSVRLVANK